jgi:hypothetical protein
MSVSGQAVMEDFEDILEDDEVEQIGDFAYPLNDRHFVRFARRGPKLLVIFEAAAPRTEDLSAHHPALEALGEKMGWSVMTLISRGHSWFRDDEVIAFFDAMVDGTLLDLFESTLFYGASSAGHAALSFSICAPLSRVLALAPQAGFDDDVRGWDARFAGTEAVDFTSRYALSEENLSAAAEIYAAFDPQVAEDSRHVAHLAATPVLPLACRRLGSNLEHLFAEFGVLEDIVIDAMEGDLEPVGFFATLRARRENPAYLRALVSRLIDAERPYLEALVVRNIAERLKRGRFQKRFEMLEKQLAEQGTALPPSRNAEAAAVRDRL